MRGQFTALGPVFAMLLAAYSSYLKPEWFTYEAFLWAAELWYAYAIQVRPRLHRLTSMKCVSGVSMPSWGCLSCKAVHTDADDAVLLLCA